MDGTRWCSDCKRAKQLLGEQRIPYDFVDVDADPAGRAVVQGHNDGKDIILTIVFDDGSVLVEPSNAELVHRRTGRRLRVVGAGRGALPSGVVYLRYRVAR